MDVHVIRKLITDWWHKLSRVNQECVEVFPNANKSPMKRCVGNFISHSDKIDAPSHRHLSPNKFILFAVSPFVGAFALSFGRFERRWWRKRELLQLMRSINARGAFCVWVPCVQWRAYNNRKMSFAGGDNLTIFTGQLKLCDVTLNYSCSVYACGQETNQQQQQRLNAERQNDEFFLFSSSIAFCWIMSWCSDARLSRSNIFPSVSFNFIEHTAQRSCWYVYVVLKSIRWRCDILSRSKQFSVSCRFVSPCLVPA